MIDRIKPRLGDVLLIYQRMRILLLISESSRCSSEPDRKKKSPRPFGAGFAWKMDRSDLLGAKLFENLVVALKHRTWVFEETCGNAGVVEDLLADQCRKLSIGLAETR